MAETSVGKILRLARRADPQFIELYNENHDEMGKFASGTGSAKDASDKALAATKSSLGAYDAHTVAAAAWYGVAMGSTGAAAGAAREVATAHLDAARSELNGGVNRYQGSPDTRDSLAGRASYLAGQAHSDAVAAQTRDPANYIAGFIGDKTYYADGHGGNALGPYAKH
jgi:hypothetical protein